MNVRACSIKLSLVGLSIMLGHQASAQSCQPPLPSNFFEKAPEALTARFAGALLLFEKPNVGDDLDTPNSARVWLFERGCYFLDATFPKGRIWFAINNHSKDKSNKSPAYTGIQIFKFFAATQPSTPLLTAYHNNKRPWYFEGRQVPDYTFREWRAPLVDWNTKANDKSSLSSYRSAVYPVVEGYWHTSSRSDERSAWDRREWWRVNVELQNQYQMILDNLLISFEPATDKIGHGIPFYLTVGEAEAVIIRYYSELSEQNSEVRLCFKNCEAFANLQITETP